MQGELEGAEPSSNEIECLQMPAAQAFAPHGGKFSSRMAD